MGESLAGAPEKFKNRAAQGIPEAKRRWQELETPYTRAGIVYGGNSSLLSRTARKFVRTHSRVALRGTTMKMHLKSISQPRVALAATSDPLITWKTFLVNVLIAVNDLLDRKANPST